MKKSLLLLVVFALIVVSMFAGTPRYYTQGLALTAGMPQVITDIINNTNATTNANYTASAELVGTGHTLYTGVAPVTTIQIYRLATAAVFKLQLGSFDTQWVPGQTVHVVITYIASGETASWDAVIPTGTTAWTVLNPTQIVPPYPVAGFNLNVNSNYPGAEIWKDGQDTGFTTPHTFFPGAAGTYSVAMPFVNWTNNPIVVPALTAETTIRFLGVMTPDPAMTPFPADLATINIAWDAVPVVYNLTWAAPISGPAPTGYTIAWNGGAPIDLGNVLTWATPAIAEGSYTWTVTPYITDPAKGTSRSMAPVKVKVNGNTAKGASTTSVPWHFTIVREGAPTWNVTITSSPAGAAIFAMGVDTGMVTPHMFNLPQGFNTIFRVELPNYEWAPIDYIVSNLSADASVDFIGTYVTTGGDIEIPFTAGLTFFEPPVDPIIPGYTIDPGATTYFFQGTSSAKALFPFVIAGPPASTWYVYAWYSAVMHAYPGNPVTGPYPYNGTIFVPSMPPTPWTVILSTSPIVITLPVELSSFTAVLDAEYFVNLTWVTESETGVSGFNVYRNESSDFNNAVQVNPSLIPATNTSEQQTYSLQDTEVNTGTTYYYWLENVDMGGGSALHGPQMVTVTGNPTPVLPEISMLNNAYPNPFRTGANTNINVSIKAGETGTVTVYNILGQTVKSFKVNEGTHTLKWNGSGCGSGIYFYKLTTPTTNATKKLVIVK